MKVILSADVIDLGNIGEVVNVKDGYARNFLIPKGLAVEATTRNVARLQHEHTRIEAKMKRVMADAETLAKRIEQAQVRITAKVGEEERLFGSVTSAMIAEKLAEAGLDIDRRKIQLAEPIRTTGVFTVTVKVHRDVNAEVKVWVTAKEA
ncbi:MAG: 50S ribosomal protein L9 [Candidatus Lernaella stagnicola]|nr:50S ribosomal protein L9 [Candidatus Lernaella stagnicola]